jgi:hypothetical protein
MKDVFGLASAGGWALLSVAFVLVMLLVISFRSRSYVFCQYLKTMTGIRLKPREVRAAHRVGGKQGVRELFLDLIIREDLKQGPVVIPDGPTTADVKSRT